MIESWFDLIPTTEMITWRRYLHQHPELSFHEVNTCKYLIKILQSFGNIQIEQPTPTSVLGTIKGSKSGKKILIRSDIDALPVDEETGLKFASQTPHVMHACGHDTHMAILLAAAKVLVQLRNQFAGTVQVLFQHAEELPPGGAKDIVASGYLKNIDAIIGLHIIPFNPVGSINITPSWPMSTASDIL
ncbi:amidohydrolase, partial [Lactobacillus sp. XV13L]|nr:amidohydrolase [Lactobacillus sp. XV13L]